MKLETKLAKLFGKLAKVDTTAESTAAGVLAVVTEGKVKTVEQFNELVQLAYTANGWHAKAGRPAEGAEEAEGVPNTVRTYVTIIRQALRLELKVATYDSFSALRRDLKKKTAAAAAANDDGEEAPTPATKRNGNGHGTSVVPFRTPKAVEEELKGVVITEPVDRVNGALFHDLVAVYVKLPKKARDQFEEKLNALLQEFQKSLSAPLRKLRALKAAA